MVKKSSKKKYEEQKTNYLANGLVLGLVYGAAVGLIFFDNLALGAGLGMLSGIVLGTALNNPSDEEPIK